MSVNERDGHQLFVRLEQVLGPEEATTLMETLPDGRSEVATEQDLLVLKYELLAELRHDMTNRTRTLVFALAGRVISISGLALLR